MRKHLTVLLVYSLLAILMTMPLGLNFTTVIPGVEGDAASFVWALGWMKTALFNLHINPIHTDFIFYPLGGATQLLWTISLIAIVSIPLQYCFGLIVAHNLLYLAATVLSAYGAYLLAEQVLSNANSSNIKHPIDSSPLPPYQTFLVAKFVIAQRQIATRRSLFAPFVAGVVFAFAPLRLGYGLSFLNLFNTQFIPFYILFLMRAIQKRSRNAVVVAGMFLGLNAYIDFQIVAFLVLFTGLYAGYRAINILVSREKVTAIGSDTDVFVDSTAHPRFKGVLEAAWVSARIAIVSLIVALPMFALIGNDFMIEGGNYIRVYKLDYSAERSYDLVSFFVPNARSTLYTNAPLKIAGVNSGVQVGDESALSPDRQTFVGYIVLGLAIYAALFRWKRARFWVLAIVVFALLSLGPSLHVLGRDTGFPLPYVLLHDIPIINHIRIPMRYGIMVFLGLAIMSAIALEGFSISRFPVPGYAVWLLPITILIEFAVLPYPIQTIPFPRLYEEIASEPGDFTVLEIPTFNWRGAATAELYQAIHSKRILRAYTNRVAPGPAEYFGTRGTPIVVRSLRILEGAETGSLAPEDIAEDKRVRDQVLRFFDLRYAIVHRDFLTTDEMSRIDEYLRDVLGARIYFEDEQVIGYILPEVFISPEKLTIDLRENIGQMYAGRGWQFEYPQANWQGRFNFVWARGSQSEIYFVGDDIANKDVMLIPPDAHESRDIVANVVQHTLTLHAHAESPQKVGVSLNGESIDNIILSTEWKDYRFPLPLHSLKTGMNVVRLEYGSDITETIGVTIITIE